MMKIKSLYIIFFILIKINFQLISQSIVTPQLFLASAKDEHIMNLKSNKIDFINKTDYKIPLIESFSLRTETNRFEWQRQEILGRVNFNGFKEIKSQKQVQQSKALLETAEKDVVLENILLERYAVLVEYKHLIGSIEAQQKLLVILKDKLDVLRRLVKITSDFDIYALIKAEEEYYELQQKITKENGEKMVLLAYIADILKLKENISVDTAGWIPLSKIRDFSDNFSTITAFSPFEKRQTASLNLLESEYNLEKAQAKRVLDFAQVRYGNRINDVFRNEFSVGIGVLLPYQGSSKIDLNDIAVKQLEVNNQLKNFQFMRARNIQVLRNEIKNLFNQYELLQIQLKDSQSQFTLNEYSKLQAAQPLVLLRLKEIILKRQTELIVLEHSIHEKYIKLLEISGKVSELPLRNYLSESLSSF